MPAVALVEKNRMWSFGNCDVPTWGLPVNSLSTLRGAAACAGP